MTDAVPRRRWPWVVGILAVLLVAAIPATYVIASVAGPSPRLAQVEQEPILVAPIEAIELGRQTRQSQWGVGLPDVSAYVVVAYQVDTTPEAALDSWNGAYGQQYELQDAQHTGYAALTGSTDAVVVSVRASDRVEFADAGPEFTTPEAGSTVITVYAGGQA